MKERTCNRFRFAAGKEGGKGAKFLRPLYPIVGVGVDVELCKSAFTSIRGLCGNVPQQMLGGWTELKKKKKKTNVGGGV